MIDRSILIKLGALKIQQKLTGKVRAVIWSSPLSFLSSPELPMGALQPFSHFCCIFSQLVFF